MAVKTRFYPQDFIKILTNYALGSFIQAAPIAEGTVQTNYFLETTQGKYVFRYYENRTIESALFENHLLTYLKKHEFPSPTPVSNSAGDFVWLFNQKPLALFEFIEGHSLRQLKESHQQQVCHLAATLHLLTQSYQPVNKPHRWHYTPTFCRTLALKKSHQLENENARRKNDWLAYQLDLLQLPASLPKGICHCDYDPSNLLFQNDRLVALIDFDDANETFLSYDLALLFGLRAWPYPINELDIQQARRMLHWYMEKRPLTRVEKYHLFDVLKLTILIDCVWFFERGTANDFYEKRKIEFLNNLGRQQFFDSLFKV